MTSPTCRVSMPADFQKLIILQRISKPDLGVAGAQLATPRPQRPGLRKLIPSHLSWNTKVLKYALTGDNTDYRDGIESEFIGAIRGSYLHKPAQTFSVAVKSK